MAVLELFYCACQKAFDFGGKNTCIGKCIQTNIILTLCILSILSANSEDLDEMPHNMAFQALHCLLR